MRMPCAVLLLALLLTALTGTAPGLAASAPTASTPAASIAGKVLESGSGLPLLGVTVSAVGPTNSTTHTDAQGNFTLDGLMPGRYLLIATLLGYENTESEDRKSTRLNSSH